MQALLSHLLKTCIAHMQSMKNASCLSRPEQALLFYKSVPHFIEVQVHVYEAGCFKPMCKQKILSGAEVNHHKCTDSIYYSKLYFCMGTQLILEGQAVGH